MFSDSFNSLIYCFQTIRSKLKYAHKTAASNASAAVTSRYTVSDSESETESVEEWSPRSNQNTITAKSSQTKDKEPQLQGVLDSQ